MNKFCSICTRKRVYTEFWIIRTKLCRAVHALDQAARRIIGVALEHMVVRADHRKYPTLGVVGELEALPVVRLRIVFIGTDQ